MSRRPSCLLQHCQRYSGDTLEVSAGRGGAQGRMAEADGRWYGTRWYSSLSRNSVCLAQILLWRAVHGSGAAPRPVVIESASRLEIGGR